MRTTLVVAVLVLAFAATAFAEKPKVLVLPLAPTHAIDAGTARTFDARLLVALDDTKRVQTITHDEEPECTTMKCLAALGTETGAAYVLAMSAVREDSGLTLFGTLVDVKTATAWRRVELPRVNPAMLSKVAPAELVPQILGLTPGPAVLGFARPTDPAAVTATQVMAEHLGGLRAFKVIPVDGTDRSPLTHRADLVISELAIATPRRHLCKWLDGTLVGTFSVTDLSNGRVIFTKTAAIQVSRRAHFSSETEVADLLVGGAVEQWMTAFLQQGVLKPRR
jgi:hypothetical protein